jgi:hypothetical protein
LHAFLSLLLICGALVQQTPGGGRLRPPSQVPCSRNELTSFTGDVTGYSRSERRVAISLQTDEGTREKFVLRYSGKEELERLYLLWNKPFGPAGWAAIESETRRLRPGMRATVWVCKGGANPLVDWQPPSPRKD